MDLVVVVLSQSLLSASHLARAPLQLFDLRVWASRLTLNFKIRQFITTTIRSTLLCSFFTCDSLRVLGICSPAHLQLTTSWPFHAIAQAKISLGISPSKPIMSGLYAQQHVQRHLSYSSAPSLFLWDINSSGISKNSSASICVFENWSLHCGGCQASISFLKPREITGHNESDTELMLRVYRQGDGKSFRQ